MWASCNHSKKAFLCKLEQRSAVVRYRVGLRCLVLVRSAC